MGSPLGPVLAEIFMVELETHLIPTLKGHLLCWKCHVDDIICFHKTGSASHILTTINNFHPSIKFTYETESDNRIFITFCNFSTLLKSVILNQLYTPYVK